ncbi:hypothetical protein EFK50_16000 [Nocardioides marmoriginsengisoli]|uniref:Uncharacterized protein n=1 Tax=Nocardioides marmoriginsengisoli TaxID=661483 RepID=A0A3N0CID9_9ACTN|nr:hypothetical protein [Nocardioides marmoriginsengisoli]RNL63200.1 hypothetical protein EFK50_16000 [Nocardioides marmoriginsengisoli]
MTTKHHAPPDAGLDDLDLDAEGFRDAVHFRRIIAAQKAIDAAEQELSDAVAAAREAGDPWLMIGAALGVTKQAAYQRFGKARAG